MNALRIFFLLIAAHAVTDAALQTDFISRNKVPGNPMFIFVLPAHGLINGLGVFLATNSVILGIAETVLHSLIDMGKCYKLYNLKVDQLMHFICKLVWLYAACKRIA